ncbi:ribonuclease D [Lysobacter fragariae]
MHLWIADPAALQAHFATKPARIGLDTEFIRERTYWPQLALVQLAIGDTILLIDPLVPGMVEALAPILADESILKLVHSPSEDLVAFKHACDVVPAPLFDTQQAAALAGIGSGLGYQKLVEQLTGVALAKGETRSDWLRRPLSPSQLDYAEDDVRHLAAMHDALQGMLEQLGRMPWLLEDAERTVRNARSEGPERWPHLAVRSAQFIDRDAQARLVRVLRWRDVYARDNDRPRGWILDNELAVALTRNPPADRTALHAWLESQPKAPRKLAEALWLALNTPLADEAEMPDASLAETRDKQRLRKLQDAVSKRAEELGLPDGVLASKRWLQALLDDGEWPAALSGWRREALEPALAPILSAPAAAPSAAQG